jgi:hypothetical protein
MSRMSHHLIRPVERECICPKRPPETHTQQCDQSFQAKFFGTWESVRDRFYRDPHGSN